MIKINSRNFGLALAASLSWLGANGCAVPVDGDGSDAEIATQQGELSSNLVGANLKNPNQAAQLPVMKPVCSTITFDNVTDGTVIDSLYPGVTFFSLTSTSSPRGHVYARSWLSGSVASVLPTGTPIFDSTIYHPYPTTGPYDGGGYVLAQFASDVSSVSVDATPVPHVGNGPGPHSQRPFLQTFDANGHHLATGYDPLTEADPNYAQPYTISLSGTGIRMIAMSVEATGWGDPAVSGVFDNLRYCR